MTTDTVQQHDIQGEEAAERGVKAPETSVVIRAFNEERWLPEVLTALERQVYRDFEVILVDSGSVDRTRDIAAAAGARIVRMRTEDFTFGHSLNVGIEAARGSFMAIVSAHAIPADEHWLGRLIDPLRKHDVAMVFGGQRGHELSKFSESRDFERVFGDQPRELRFPDYFANNANSAVRRDLWEQYPFDEGLPGLEDIGWAKHWIDQGMAVHYIPDACIIHVHTETWPQVRRRYHREGIAARWVGLKVLRQIPGELAREALWLCKDVALALGRAKPGLIPEIVRFRYEKTVGTVRGIVDSRGFTNPARRAELWFDTPYSAVVIRGPKKVAIEERSIPELKPGEVLIRVAYVGVCGTDLEIRDGTLGYYRTGLAHYPIVPGHEFSGTVAAVGPRVTDFVEGQTVVVECIQGCGECEHCRADQAIRCAERQEVGVMRKDGAYAEYVVTRARYVHLVPEGLSLREAALAEPLAVVMKALRRLGATTTSSEPRPCAVVGAGAIGHLTARVLAARGHHVTIFDREAGRLERIGDGIETSKTLTDLHRFEWFVEATGSQEVLSVLLEQSPVGASLLLLGFPYSRQDFSFESIVGFDRMVVGSVGSAAQDFESALALLPSLGLADDLTSTYPLAEWERAWQAVRGQNGVKVLLQVE